MGKHREIKDGDVYYHLKVIENLGIKQKNGRNMTFYLCECLKCGKKIEVPVSLNDPPKMVHRSTISLLRLKLFLKEQKYLTEYHVVQ